MDRAVVDAARAVLVEDEAQRLGIAVRGRTHAGPCPVCGGRDRFWIDTNKQAWGCRVCATGGDAIALVMHVEGLDFMAAVREITGGAVRPPRPSPPRQQTDDDRAAEQVRKAGWLWDQRRPLAGSLAERYLRERGIAGPFPDTLAFLPALRTDYHPAMIARFGLGAVGAVHLTFLSPDGTKKADVERAKIVVGRSREPIVVAAPPDHGECDVTEGIEDALSVRGGSRGVLAAGAAGRMPWAADAVPRTASRVVIWAHPDPAGRAGAAALASELWERFIPCRIEGISS